MIKVILILLIIISSCIAQSKKIYKRDLSREVKEMFSDSAEAVVDTLTSSAKDTINAFIEDSITTATTQWRSDIEDSISTATDTTALKLNTGSEGHLCYLKQLSSANTNGGGWFVAADSTYPEPFGNWAFDHPTSGLQWVSEVVITQKEYWVNADMDSTALRAVFDSAAAQTSAKITFKQGEYSIPYYAYGGVDIWNANNLVIEGNGSTIDFNEGQWYITPGVSRNVWNTAYHIAGVDGNDFTTDLRPDSNWVGIADPDSFPVLTRGDLVLIGDTTGYSTVNQQLLVFYRIDTLENKMFFESYPTTFVYKDSMADWSTGHASYLFNADTAAFHHVPCGGHNLIINNLIVLNGELRISSWENAIVNNCIGIFEGLPRMSISTKSNSFIYSYWNKNFIASNVTADGWGIGGEGYGIALQRCYDGKLSNFTTFDCKHPITTVNCTRVEVVNSTATVSDSVKSLISTLNAFSTHPGTDYTRYQNCYVEGYDAAFYHRGQDMDIINCITKNCPIFLTLEKHRKRRDVGKKVTIRDCKAYDCRAMADVFDLGNVQRLELINNEMYKRYAPLSVGTVVNVRLTTPVDTIIISGGYYDGLGWDGTYDGTGAAILNATQDTSQFNIAYMRMNNVRFKEFEYGLYFDNPPSDFEARDCEFEDVDKLIVQTSISADATEYQNFSWIDNKIKNADSFHASSGANSIISNWFIKGNTFDDVSEICDFSNVYVDTVKFIENTFVGGDSITSMFDLGGAKGSGGLIYFLKNDFYDIHRYKMFIQGSASTGTGYIPKSIFNGNNFYNIDAGFNFMALDSTWTQMTNNTIEINEITNANHFILRPTRSVFDFRNNDVYINNVATHRFIDTGTASDSVTFGGNTFTGTGATHVAIDQNEGSLIWIPTNYLKGCTIDTVGATHYDSTYVNY